MATTLSYAETQKLEKAAVKAMTRDQKAASEQRAAERRAEYEAETRRLLLEALADADAVLAASFRTIQARAQVTLDDFAEKLKTDPRYAVEWMNEKIFDAAVTVHHAAGFAAYCENGEPNQGDPLTGRPAVTKAETCLDEIEKRARRLTTERPRSTSRTSNMTEEADRVVLREWAYGESWHGIMVRSDKHRLHVSLRAWAEACKHYRKGDVDLALDAIHHSI